jgi:hypothetical protein
VDPSVVKALSDNGLTGILVAVIVLLHWHTVKVQIPALFDRLDRVLESIQKANREDRAEDRATYLRGVEGIGGRLQRIEEKIDKK